MARILTVQKYQMFCGVMKIDAGKAKGQEIYGDWLYRPDTGCWYNGTAEYAKDRCTILEVE